MKKLLAVVLAAAMLLSMAACDGTAKPPEETDDKKMDNTVAIILQQGGLGDQGYNDGAKIGLDKMTEKYGVKGTLVEAVAPAEADTFVRQLAEQGYPLVICLDWTIIDYVKEASKDYPDTLFVVLGKGLPGPGTQENLVEPFTALHEWAYVAGLAMIELARDGNELFESQNSKPGVTFATIHPGESVNAGRLRGAYMQAIYDLYPDAKWIPDYTGSYTDSALNQQIAENLIVNQGVEVFWPVLGTGALATFSTAKQFDSLVLGCDSDQDGVEPGTVATSVLHNTTYMVTNLVEEWKAGTLKGTNEYYWGLDSGVVGLTDFSTIEGVEGVNKEALARIKTAIDEQVAKIISGEYIVYNYFLEDLVEFPDWVAAHPGTTYTEWVKAGRP